MEDKEKLFHRARTAFIILEGEVLLLKNSELSHKDWIVGQLKISIDKFRKCTRGYTRNDEIYFYTEDFETNSQVEFDAFTYTNVIAKMINKNKFKHIYCGVIKGKVGDIWKGKKEIKLKI